LDEAGEKLPSPGAPEDRTLLLPEVGKRFKVAWIEPGDPQPRRVRGLIIGCGNGFITLDLGNGRSLSIRADLILKVESVEG
jgi:hypothetical protein